MRTSSVHSVWRDQVTDKEQPCIVTTEQEPVWSEVISTTFFSPSRLKLFVSAQSGIITSAGWHTSEP
uniref:Uncharacterized protein n=1 Tax=Anguilla anguilla TaxID=7936 RepID=A0A0E9X3G2_ANGAN